MPTILGGIMARQHMLSNIISEKGVINELAWLSQYGMVMFKITT